MPNLAIITYQIHVCLRVLALTTISLGQIQSGQVDWAGGQETCRKMYRQFVLRINYAAVQYY